MDEALRTFSGCRVTVAYGDGRPDLEDVDGDLQLAGGALLLTYWDEHGPVVFAGAEAAPGRYELTARSRPRRCTLQREGPHSFTGTWVQGPECGTLRVEICAGAAPEEEDS